MLRDRGRRAMVIATPLAIALLGCAGPVKVKPRVPTAPPLDDRRARVSLYLDPAITGALVVSTAPTGDLGLDDVTVTFEVGEPLSETVAGAARSVFLAVLPVATPTCAPNTVGVLEATLPTPPYAQVHWRGETPHVGGGTVAELLVRVIYRDCAGTERGRAVQDEGYLRLRRAICRVGNPASTGNLLVGGIVGLVTDQSTGAAFALYPTDLHVQLPARSPGELVFDRRPPP